MNVHGNFHKQNRFDIRYACNFECLVHFPLIISTAHSGHREKQGTLSVVTQCTNMHMSCPLLLESIKHSVTTHKSIAIVRMRRYARIYMCSATYALIANMKLTTKILRDFHMKHHAQLLSGKVFRQQQLTRSFSLPEGAIKLASLREIYLLVLSISTKTA